MKKTDLGNRIDEAEENHRDAQNQLDKAKTSSRGIGADRTSSPPGNSTEALQIIGPRKGYEKISTDITKEDLERLLEDGGWIHGTLDWGKNDIWTDPERETSIRIRANPDAYRELGEGDFTVRGYNGPSGGVINQMKPDFPEWRGPKGNPLPNENALDIEWKTGSQPKKTYSNNSPATHFSLNSKGSSNPEGGSGPGSGSSLLDGLGKKALGPISWGLDVSGLYEAYEADGGEMGKNVKEEAGGVAGGIAGGSAGALMGGTLGSLASPLGTGIGAYAGGALGGMFGDSIGREASSGDLIDSSKATASSSEDSGGGIVDSITDTVSDFGKSVRDTVSDFGSTIGEAFSGGSEDEADAGSEIDSGPGADSRADSGPDANTGGPF